MERRETPAYLEADRAWSGGEEVQRLLHQHLHELLSVVGQELPVGWATPSLGLAPARVSSTARTVPRAGEPAVL
jgi:hypothetical protein